MTHLPIVLLPAEYCDPERGVKWALACIRTYACPNEPCTDDDARWMGRYLYALATVLYKAEQEPIKDDDEYLSSGEADRQNRR